MKPNHDRGLITISDNQKLGITILEVSLKSNFQYGTNMIIILLN